MSFTRALRTTCFALSRVTIALLLWLACAAISSAQLVTIADPGTYVVDRANIIDAETEAGLERTLKELEQKTTAQIKVLTVTSIGDDEWFNFVQRHYDQWRLGQKGKDNGALVALSVNDREVRIHTGYGLEGTLPDSWIGTASRRVRDEYFRVGRYSEGLDQLTRLAATRVADEAGVQLDGAVRLPEANPVAVDLCGLLWPLLIVLLVFYLQYRFSRARRGGRQWRSSPWGGFGGGGFGGGWGGGFGGGRGGGFGGGGGSFGGGGRSGGGGGGASW